MINNILINMLLDFGFISARLCVYVCIYGWMDGFRESLNERRGRGRGERESQVDSLPTSELVGGLDLTTLRS